MSRVGVCLAILCCAGCADRPLPLPEPGDLAGAPVVDLGAPDLPVSDLARAPLDLTAPDGGPFQPARLLSPLSTATVTTRRPSLRWVPTGGGTEVELCADRACARRLGFAAIDASGSRATPRADLPTGPVFWRVDTVDGEGTVRATSATWELFVGARSAAVDSSYGATLDVDGDGRPDVAVGALGLGTAGAVYLYRDGAACLGAPLVVPIDDQPMWSAFLVANAGDLDGDGYPELAVSAIAVSGQPSEGGLVRIYPGGPNGLDPSRLQRLDPVDPPVAYQQFGRTVGSAGDVNGDGWGDLVVTTAGLQPVAYVLLGGPDGVRSDDPSRVWRMTLTNQNAGLASAACDFNGDGYGDVLIGSPYDTVGGTQYAGEAFVYFGGPSGLSAPTTLTPSPTPSPASEYFGWAATATDVDGDGYCDAVVADAMGAAYVFAGGPGPLATTPAHRLTGSAQFNTVARAGDLDGDGYEDLVFGGQAATAVTVVFGRRFTSLAIPTTGEPGFGWAVDGVGDLDGDGFGEVAATVSTNAPGAARLYVYSGRSLGSATPDGGVASFDGPSDGGATWGYSVAGLR